MEPGDSWAYRARQVDPLVEVFVVRLGTQKPARVLVRFVDDEFEGREEWVPPARLKVPWSEVEEYRVREKRWDRLYATGLDRDDPREDAALQVLELLIGNEVASIGYRQGGAISICQPEALANQLGLGVEQLTGHPDSFAEDGVVIAPWEVTELVVRTAAEQSPERIMQCVWAEERKARYEAIHGHYLLTTRGKETYISPERSVEFDTDYLKPRREVLRSWCGVQAVERFDELVELRREIKRVGDVALSAIAALRAAGHVSQASRLERELGTPVEMLRTDQPGT
jgi:hypothetical protein